MSRLRRSPLWSRLVLPAAVLSILSISGIAPRALTAQVDTIDPGVSAGGRGGRIAVLVELAEPPAALVYGNALEQNAALPARQARDLAVRAAQTQLRAIALQQTRFDAALAALPGSRTEIYRVKKAYNGIAFQVDRADMNALRRLPGVRAVHILELEYPTNSTSVPFLGVPNLWANTIGLSQGLTGTGIKIGVIDTGIDYQHAHFGGTGLLADYQANDRTVAPDAFFPSAKVVGGTDFAGDAYSGGNIPVPDADPMDCNGHGTHVAGTAAGYGVNADGSTYAGPFDNSAPFGALRIGPGVAPQGNLYALRVFGCTGGTNLTVQAIDWSADPNGDDDLSDHLDVINMSLGSTFGRLSSTSAVAADNAAAAGVIVVTSAGNSGDTFYISGSPGSASRAIATAASVDSGIAGVLLQINTPPAIAGGYAASAANTFAPTPAPAASGQTAAVVLSQDPSDAAGPLTTDGCSPFTNAAAVAGNIAVVDRGTCGFQVKAVNAQAAGAIGVIIANNVAGDPTLISMGATGTTQVNIPAVFVSKADRDTIVGQLPGVNATLAAATAADTIASFSSRGPRLGKPNRLKPDIAAPGLNITSAQTGVTCTAGACQRPDPSGFAAGSLTLTISGTSMASPHMAGMMALLRELHPDWTVEQLKALALNGALHNVTLGANGSGLRYGPGRVGSGRVDPANSALATVVALNGEETGVVSVSFDTNEAVGASTEVKTVRLVNTGTSAATYDLSFDISNDAPGLAFSLPGGATVTVPAGDSVELDVQLDATPLQMDHVRDPSVPPTQTVTAPASLANLAIPRHWLTEEAGYLVLSQGGTPKLHLPLYVNSRAASAMTAPATISTGGSPTGTTAIPLTGTGVCTGTLVAGPGCTGTFPTDQVSLVSPFELQVVSPRDTVNAPDYADLQYAGAATDGTRIWFGLSTWADWSSPTDVSFNVYIDTNLDNVADRIVFNTNSGNLARIFGVTTQADTDAFITAVFIPPGSISSVIAAGTPGFVNRASAALSDTALFNNNVMFFGATPAQLGLANTSAPFRYWIETCPGFAPLCQTLNGFHFDSAPGPFNWNGGAQGLNFGGGNLFLDLNGATLPVTWNTANMAVNGSLGALLLHHYNKAGERAEVVLLEGTPSADLALAKSVSPVSPVLGQNVTFTLTVTNNGPGAAAGIQVTDELPAGLTYVSDDGAAAFDPSTGTWTIAALAASVSATLHIVATVESTEEVCNLALITAGLPLDPNPADNQSEVCVMALRAADLLLGMTVSSPTVLVGGAVTYTITATNNGDDTAYAVDVQETFAAFPLLNPTGFTASQGSYDPATGLWNLASLGQGVSATLALTFTAPNTAGALTNQGTASAGTSDPDNANNTASATTTVLSPATITATKTVAGTFTEGGAITYTVVLSNSSAFDQQNNPGPELTDVLPSQVTLVSASATAGTATATVGTNTVTWDGVVPGNGSVTITIQATINAGTSFQTVSNQATTSFDADGNGVNEASATSTAPGGGPTTFVVLSPSSIGTRTKTASGNLVAGGNVTYTVTISNPSTAAQTDNPGDEFTDVLPAGLTLTGATASSGAATTAGNTLHWNGGIAAGGSVTITITATINNGTAGQSISNQGTILFDADGNGTNESTALTDDPAVGGADDPTVFVVGGPPEAEIPTLSEIGLALLALLMVSGALLTLRRRRA